MSAETRITTCRPGAAGVNPAIRARNISRAWRFTRLRRTALPANFFDTTMPSAAVSAARQNSEKCRLRARRGLLKMAAKSALPKVRGPAPLRPASFNASDRETLAPFGPTRANDCPPTLGFHADQKAMGALATDDGRLIGAFHDSSGRPCGRIRLDDEQMKNYLEGRTRRTKHTRHARKAEKSALMTHPSANKFCGKPVIKQLFRPLRQYRDPSRSVDNSTEKR